MSQIIKCPKCNERDWSSDYWYCPSCNYYVAQEEMLLEMNQDSFEGRGRGDELQKDLGFWVEGQKTLCQDMVDYLLPNHNLERVSFNESKNWGETIYYENDQNKANQAKQRFLENGGIEERVNWFTGSYLHYKPYVRDLTNYNQSPSKINISPQTLETELSFETSYGIIGGIDGTGAGFLPTTAHESAHASHEVNWDIFHRPWINESHDDVWKRVYIKFFQQLQQKYGEEVKKRFIEYRKITGKEDNKYD